MRLGSGPAKRDIASTLSQQEMVTNSLSVARSSRNICTSGAFSARGLTPSL